MPVVTSGSMGESCGTGRWCEPGFPHRGWKCICVETLEDLQTCEMCQVAQIRYGHHMEHGDVPETLVVGCVCAENMCEGYNGKAMEREARADARRRRALHRGLQTIVWRDSRSGTSIYCRTRDDYVGIVFWKFCPWLPSPKQYGVCVKDTQGGRQRVVDRLNNEAEAKATAIALIEKMREI
ncbi:MAG: hypothetical protein C5B60_07800 [Chloroflexi bacterium]|nr:MAG: hypothetical protein C5B60_07800 [Chloroflexota bacterium]